jgi:hypothetical protein
MRFESDHAINNVYALPVPTGGPLDIALFIESRFQFDQCRNLFASLNRINQCSSRSASFFPCGKDRF